MKTDAELLHGTVSGDTASFAELYDKYKSELFCYALAILRDHTLAEDITHDTFLQLYDEGHTIHTPHALRKWLYVVIRRLSFNALSRKRKIETIDDDKPSDDPSPFDAAERSTSHELLEHAIGRLSAPHREVLFLREYLQLSYDEICLVTGSTLPATKSKLHKARKALAAVLAPYSREWRQYEKM